MKKQPALLVFSVIFILLLAAQVSATFALNLQNWLRQPPAIILFIGDGMGESHITAARWYAAGREGSLVMDQLTYTGWSDTASAVSPVTDSAAAATAIATGTRTYNGILGMDIKKNILETILEQAQRKGLAVGLVSTTNMTNATPAAFATHIASRQDYKEIAAQILNRKINVILGGGEDDFIPPVESGCYPGHGWRMDERNLIQEAVDWGYTHVCTTGDLLAIKPKNTSYLLGLFSDEGMERPFEPSLAQMTETAIEVLSQDPDGFFLMVEGGQIDWAAHDNYASEVITDVLGLDEAVAVGIEYVKYAEDSLLIVTADHETGGMTVSLEATGDWDEDGPFYMPDGTPFFVNWRLDDHTAAEVPVLSMGYLAQKLHGHFENTFIYEVMSQALNRE